MSSGVSQRLKALNGKTHDHLSNKEKSFSSELRTAQLQESHRARKDLHEALKETQEISGKEHNKLLTLLTTTKNERDRAVQYFRAKRTENSELTHQVNAYLTEINRLQSTLAHKDNEASLSQDTNALLRAALSQLEATSKSRDELTKHSLESAQEFEQLTGEHQKLLSGLRSEKDQLNSEIGQLHKKLATLESHNAKLSASLLGLRSQNSVLENKSALYDQQQLSEKELQGTIAALKTSNKSLKAANAQLNTAFKAQLEDLATHNAVLAKQHKEALREHDSSTILSEQKTQQLSQLTEDLQTLKQLNSELSQRHTVQSDLSQMVTQLAAQNSESQRQQASLSKELHTVTGTMQLQSASIKDAERALDSLQAALSEKTQENTGLTALIKALQQKRPIYHPAAEDPVDIALADYVNTVEPALPLHFVREESGIYSFGTKRVFVKLEQGKVIIRVGGGFMRVEDFAAIYTPQELDKYEKKQRGKAQHIRKSLYGKLADSLATGQGRKQSTSSPFSPFYGVTKGASPARAASPQLKRSPNKS